jgi:hypothetical protein
MVLFLSGLSSYNNLLQSYYRVKEKSSRTTMHFAQYDGQVYPQHWASLPILMGKVAQRLGQMLTTPFVDFS